MTMDVHTNKLVPESPLRAVAKLTAFAAGELGSIKGFWGRETAANTTKNEGAARNLLEIGGQGRNRTADASLFRAALYRLSYLAGKLDCRSRSDCCQT